MKDSDIIRIKQRKIKHWIIVLIFLIVILAAVKLKVTDIRVLGTRTYSDSEAIDLVFPDEYDLNTVYIVINKLLGRKKDIPFVADYEIHLLGPESAELIIYEQNPIACVRYISSYMYFDQDGIVLESSDTLMEGIPVVEGLSFGHIVLNERIPLDNDALLKDILNITQQTALYGVSAERIRFDSAGMATLILDGGDIEVELGSNEDISVKISLMCDMLPEIRKKGLKGYLDLSGYDESSSGQVISFKIR